jgi:hypothetical protein
LSDNISESGQEKEALATMIDVLDDLSVLQKRFLHSRWLDQLLWLDGKARTSQTRYYALRLVAIIGGVIVPSLVGLRLDNPGLISVFKFWFTISLSLLVAICVAVEEFFHYGERWRHYRRLVEILKSEGWQFFQLAGAYENYPRHSEAYSAFAARVEEILRQDMEMFLTQVAQENKGKREGGEAPDK